MAIDENKLNEMIGKVISDIGAIFHAPLVLIGERLGLFKKLATGKMNGEELAAATGTVDRYVQEWLPAMASGGYVSYDPKDEKYYLTEEQVMVLADEDSPAYMPGAFQAATAAIKSEPKINQAFKTGGGVNYLDHDAELFPGTENFYKPLYRTNLVQNWIPSLDGVQQKLEAGASVADIGCGYGFSTILMAQAFPKSRFVGYDYHEPSIVVARQRAENARVSDRVSFEPVSAHDMGSTGFDFITSFDCVHDMGNPAGAAKKVLDALKPDGTWMIVEPFAADRVEENFSPVGRLYYCASVTLCVSCALDQDDAVHALGAQAGEKKLKEVILSAGFTRFRRAAESPINIVYEVRP